MGGIAVSSKMFTNNVINEISFCFLTMMIYLRLVEKIIFCRSYCEK